MRTARHEADLVLTAPVTMLSDSWREKPRRRRARRNPAEAGAPYQRTVRRKEKDLPPSRIPQVLFGGHAGLLVRTALVRAEGFDAAKRNLPQIDSSRDVVSICSHLADADNEYVVVLALNSRSRVVAIYEAAIGGVEQAAADSRQVLKVAMLTGAPSVILVHNHPSGSIEPSPEDISFTKQVQGACQCVGIRMLDHVIVGHEGKFSFLDAGLLRMKTVA